MRSEAAYPVGAEGVTQDPPSSRLYQQMLLFSGAWTVMGVALYLVAPMTAPLVLGLAAIAPLAWCWATEGQVPRRAPSPVLIALAVAGVYGLVNASWSLSRVEAYAAVGLIFLGIVVLHVTTVGLAHTPVPALRAMGVGLLIGMGVGAAILCVELLSGQWLRRTLATYHAGFRPNERDIYRAGGGLLLFQPYLLNRGIGALMFTFWPAYFVLERLALTAWQRRVLLAGLLLTPATIFLSSHETSKMVFVGAAATYGIARLSPLLARRLWITCWLIATLLVAPIAALAYGQNLHHASWLDFSARHRVVLWEFSRNEIAKAPVLGAGINTPRALHDTNVAAAPRAPGTDIPMAMPLHSHNAYLQVWHETGAVGVALLLVIGLLVLRAITAQPAALQPHAYAMFAASALLAASSFSLWAPWFLSSLFLAPVLAGIGMALPPAPTARASR